MAIHHTNKRPQVLMLGWEYPPILAGGLGMACYGLTKALSQYADITLIIPRSESEFEVENMEIIGLNHIGLDSKATPTAPNYETFTQEVTYIDTTLSPYPVGIAFAELKSAKPLSSHAEIRALYASQDPYGANIMEKVATYTEVVTQLAKEKEFDIIHAHDWITFAAAIQIKEQSGKPLVLHVHSLETDRIGTRAKYEYGINAVYDIERQAMLKADRVIPVSFFTKNCAIEHYEIPAEKFRPVYNAIDPADIMRIPREGNEKIVLFLGRITFQKGPEFMIETAIKVLQKYTNVKFFVAGIGDKLQALKELAAERGIYEKFVFAGFLRKPQVENILAQADVYFMPSVSEPFGLSALEAVQAGIPSVLSKQSGVAEVLPHTLKADYWDTDRFANYIYALLNYEGLRQDLTKNTDADIHEMTWDKSAQTVMNVYSELLA